MFPAALATAQDVGASGKEFITACVGWVRCRMSSGSVSREGTL